MPKRASGRIKAFLNDIKERSERKRACLKIQAHCLRQEKDLSRMMSLIDEAMPKAPDVAAASRLSRLRARIESCLNRVRQIHTASKEHDYERMIALNEAMQSMKALINKDVDMILAEYVYRQPEDSKCSKRGE